MKKFNIKAMKPIQLKKTKNLIEIIPRDFFKNHSKVAKALAEAIVEGDKEAFQEITEGYKSALKSR